MMAERRVVVLREIEGSSGGPRCGPHCSSISGVPRPTRCWCWSRAPTRRAEDKEIAKAARQRGLRPAAGGARAQVARPPGEELGVELPDDAARHLVRAVGGELGTLGGRAAEARRAPRRRAADGRRSRRAGRRAARGDDLRLARRGTGGPARDRRSGCSVSCWISRATRGVKLVTLLGTTLDRRRHRPRRIRPALRGRGAGGGDVRDVLRRNRMYGLLSWGEEKTRWSAGRRPGRRAGSRRRSAPPSTADRALKSTSITDERGILADMVLRMATSRRAAA